MKNTIITIILFLFISCDNSIKKEYHNNGVIKKEYRIKNGKKDGIEKEW